MQIAVLTNEVETFGVGTTADFKFNANATAFETLMNSLYSDKVGAVVRELSANAVDAHKMVGGSPQPIEVHLPTIIEPHFSIRDFGPGLAPDQMTDLYVTLFASTKDTSNDMIGGFGLGCKTPFAVSDMFTVTSYQNGIKRTYTAYRTPERGAAISLQSEEPSSEPSGLEVSFPVQSKDISDFQVAANKYLIYYPDEIKFTGADPQIKPVKYTVKNSFYGIRDEKNYYNTEARVVMGGVPYPLDISDLKLDHSKNEHNFARRPIDFFIPVGEVMVTPSRESLSYNDKTKAYLEKHIKAAVASVEDEIKDSLAKATTRYEAQGIVDAYRDIINPNSTFPYGNTVVSHAGYRVTCKTFANSKIEWEVANQYARNFSYRKRAPSIEWRNQAHITDINNTTIMHVDVDKHVGDHLLSAMKIHYNKSSSNSYQRFLLVKGDINKFLTDIDCKADYLKLSEESKFVHVKASALGSGYIHTKLYLYNLSYTHHNKVDDPNKIPALPVLWTKFEDGDPVDENMRYKIKFLVSNQIIQDKNGNDLYNVVGVPKTYWKSVEKNNTSWVSFDSFFQAEMDKIIAAFQGEAQLYRDFCYIRDSSPPLLSALLELTNNKKSFMSTADVPLLNYYRKTRKCFSTWMDKVNSVTGIDKSVPKDPSQEAKDLFNEFLTLFPFLSIMKGQSSYLNHSDVNETTLTSIIKKEYPNA